MKGLALSPLVAALVLGLGGVLLGLAPVDGLLLGMVALVVGAAGVALGAGDEHRWPEVHVEETDGTRRDVAALTWTFLGRDGRVTEAAVRKLREVAARRLARHGVRLVSITDRAGTAWAPDPEQGARASELLGPRAWRTLSAPGGVMPSVTEVAHCVDVLDRLAARPTPDPRTTAPRTTAPRTTDPRTTDERSRP